jgi:hypothetical protein
VTIAVTVGIGANLRHGSYRKAEAEDTGFFLLSFSIIPARYPKQYGGVGGSCTYDSVVDDDDDEIERFQFSASVISYMSYMSFI